MIWWIALITICTIIWYYTVPDSRLRYYGNLLPGPKPLPIVGNVLHLPKSGKEDFKIRTKLIDEYGHVIRLWAGKYLFVYLTNPADVEVVLKHAIEIKKPFVGYEFLKEWLGTGLLSSSGEKWACRRKMLTQTFHNEILEQFMGVINRRANELMETLRFENESIKIAENVAKSSIQIICESIMGKECAFSKIDIMEYIKAIRSMTNLTINRVYAPFLYNDTTWWFFGDGKMQDENIATLNRIAKKAILQKEKIITADDCYVKKNGTGYKRRMPPLEMMFKMKMNGNSVFKTDFDVLEEINTLIFAGHDTVSTSICFALELLARHQEVQEKLYQELNSNISNRENISSTDFISLPYLDCVMKETLRLYPPAPLIARHLLSDLKLPSGYTIPGDAIIGISIYHVHRNPEHYENPLEFNPNNFSDAGSVKRHPLAFIPFSAGPRNCIGKKFAMLEFKTVLSKLVLNFRVTLPEGCERSITAFGTLVLQMEGGFKVNLSER